jgi:proline iminopeptidase
MNIPADGGSLVGSRMGAGEPERGIPPSVEVGPYDVGTNVRDAIAVLDALSLDRVWLIGHSWGGHLAMHVAVARPERVRGLISISGRGAVPDGGMEAMIVELRKRYEQVYGPLTGPIRLEEGWGLRFSDPRAAPPWPGLAYSQAVLTEANNSVTEHYTRETLLRGLRHLKVPALFVHGRMDPLPVSVSVETAALMSTSTLEIIEDCGHFPWIEDPGVIGRFAGGLLVRNT